MNENIRRHFHEIEARLIECPVIHAYQIIRKEISLDDGKLRIRSSLIGGGISRLHILGPMDPESGNGWQRS